MPSQAYHSAHFLLSAAKLSQLPADCGSEVAFVGRSNAGKSSALNRITQQKRLARTSKTPGCTQLINVFMLDDDRRLIDLPGYGYAKVPQATKKQWQTLLGNYLSGRQSLTGIILLMDIRHPLTELDWQVLEWSQENTLPTHVVLTKADKLRRHATLQIQRQVEEKLAHYPQVSVQTFSALSKIGLELLYQQLDQWFSF